MDPGSDPVAALQRIAFLLEESRATSYKPQAFRRAAEVVRSVDPEELAAMAEAGTLTRLEGIGKSTAQVVVEALRGEVPGYLGELEQARSARGGAAGKGTGKKKGKGAGGAAEGDAGAHRGAAGGDPVAGEVIPDEALALRALLQGDCHSHSSWSDGGTSIREMAETARDLGHRYLAMTDHSPRLTVAHGLNAERLARQLEEIAALNEELAPFRILTGIEVDILADGSLDQTDEILGALDLVVASAHSKLRMASDEMTDRLLAAVESPHSDILGHCTGRLLAGRGRPQSTFDADTIFEACARTGTAVEINSRPER
ncbi:MAG TPA: PHP domain-containing protein, partial [Acidimicrobiales bacterium]|nr:PHP domain-containing protein [Acidimicrobiales bacterium]